MTSTSSSIWVRRLAVCVASLPLALLLACPPSPPGPEPEPTPTPTPEPSAPVDSGEPEPEPSDAGNEPEPEPTDAGNDDDGGVVVTPDGGVDGGSGGCVPPVFDGPFSDAPEPALDEVPAETMMTSARGHLVWKRARQLRNELTDALELPDDELCKELGTKNCYSVHLVALGGNDPIYDAMYEPVAQPSVVTPNAIDRFVLGACETRLQADLAIDPDAPIVDAGPDAGAPPERVFKHLPLDANLAGCEPGIDVHITDMYRRFLRRDPTSAEVAKVRELLTDVAGNPVTGADFALTTCFAVGSSVENIFY